MNVAKILKTSDIVSDIVTTSSDITAATLKRTQTSVNRTFDPIRLLNNPKILNENFKMEISTYNHLFKSTNLNNVESGLIELNKIKDELVSLKTKYKFNYLI